MIAAGDADTCGTIVSLWLKSAPPRASPRMVTGSKVQPPGTIPYFLTVVHTLGCEGAWGNHSPIE